MRNGINNNKEHIMQINEHVEAIPWVFTQEEAEVLKGMLQQPMVVDYLQVFKHMALTDKILEPVHTTKEDIVASNAYIAGQDYLLDALLSADVYVPQSKGE